MRRRSPALRRPAVAALCLGPVTLPAPVALARSAPQEAVEVINGGLALYAVTGTAANTATGWPVGSTSSNNGAGTGGGVTTS
ncbi:hypothetical protein [Streptomyces sp. NPDC088254]|uniref:hypothetical protein n=1 Tax=Streptomyces sp. NPDC088254 TaxID=3365847 RepID=UPI00380D11CB